MDSHSHTLSVMLAVIVMLTGTVSGQRFKREVVDMFAMIEDTAPEVVTEADLADLPSVVLHIDELGQIANFVAECYWEDDGKYRLEMWSTPIGEHGEMNGLMLPASGTGVWHLESGDFPYIDLKITDIEYGVPSPY